jgi:hypothetical protein
MPTHVATSPRNPAKQTRGRRVVLLMIGFIVAAQGLAGYLIDHHGLEIRFPSAAAVLRNLAKAPPPTVVWMGTSRSEGGVRSDVMNTGLWKKYGRHRVNLFNAAVPCGDPYASSYLLDAMLERGHRPEILVVEVSPDIVVRNSKWLRFHATRQMRWSDVPTVLPEAIQGDAGARFALVRLVPLFAYRTEIRKLVFMPPTGIPSPLTVSQGGAEDHSPHFEDYPEPPASPDLDRRRIEYNCDLMSRQFRDYRTDGVVSAALGRLLSRCDAEGISVVLVLPAVSEVYREKYTPEIERRFQDELTRLRGKHPFEVVDLRAGVPDAGFYDMYHLHWDSGALIYSRVALERVVLPALERRGFAPSR